LSGRGDGSPVISPARLLSFKNKYAIMTPPRVKLRWGTFMKKKIISYAILLLAVVFIIVGVMQSGYQDTLRRAAVVCLECVGIG
jgi:hypothetical protein